MQEDRMSTLNGQVSAALPAQQAMGGMLAHGLAELAADTAHAAPGGHGQGAAHGNDMLLNEIGRLTRGVHDAIRAIEPEWRIDADALRSSARDSLDYVVAITEQAAHRTMDLVERAVPIAETIARDVRGVHAQPAAAAQLDGHARLQLENSALQAEQLQSLLTDILMAQDYQDISGQIIRRVANLLREVESKLFHLVKVAAEAQAIGGLGQPEEDAPRQERSAIEAEGPIIHDGTRVDVVQGQDEVDDLLSKLGF
jgi:chemotaxis protein CheZ